MARILTRRFVPAVLSDRERAVAERFAAGLTYRQIGEALCIAPSTVRSHLATIYGKLGVRNKIELASEIAGPPEGTIEAAAEQGPPVLALFPIESLNEEQRWNRFADGLSSDICVDLARYADVPVVAFHTMKQLGNRAESYDDHVQAVGATYAVTGQVRADERQVRLTIQLSETRSGMTLWSERYDRPIGDILALQDDLTEGVVNALAGCFGRLAALGRNASRKKAPSSLHSYDYYLLGVEELNRFSPEGNAAAIRLLRRSLELDPARVRAWTELAYAHAVQACNGYGSDLDTTIGNWRSAIEQAIRLDPTNPFAHTCLGDLKACMGDLKGAADAQDVAFRHGKHNADTLALLAGSKALVAGDPDEALSLIEKAMSLNPLAPPWYYGMLGRTLFVAGRHAESLSALGRSSQEAPNTLMFQAMAQAFVGQSSEAASTALRLKTEFPLFSVERFIAGYPVTNPPALRAVQEGSRLAMFD